MSIYTLIPELISEDFYYVPNRGNAGDSVIESATFQVFEHLNLNYSIEPANSTKLNDQVVVLGGGGAIVSEDAYYTKILRECASKAKKVIVLPHTVKEIDDTLAEFGEKITFLCREKVSYEYITKLGVSCYLVDDIAFSLDVNSIKHPLTFSFRMKLIQKFVLQKLGFIPGNIRTSMFLKTFSADRIVAKTIDGSKGQSKLMAFRIDDEKTDIEIPENNFDISALYQLELGDELLSRCATYMMVSTLDAFDEIHTNRLHVAIVAAILGKKVEFYGNSYFKCQAVYENSIEGKFKSVRFVTSN